MNVEISVPDIADTGDWLFADGGVIKQNPSPMGGTWAWVRVKDGVEVARDSGILRPATIERKTVSNNNTELRALCVAITHLPYGWSGTVASDSSIALGWVFQNFKCDSIPLFLCGQLRFVVNSLAFRREGGCVINHLPLSGHPTKADLLAGKRLGKAPHYPVSKWNVLCDELCGQAGKDFVAK